MARKRIKSATGVQAGGTVLPIQAPSEQVRCPRCKAQPGEPCVAPSGVPRVKSHLARMKAAGMDLDRLVND